MGKPTHVFRLSCFALCGLLALVIIADFAWPGKVMNKQIITLKKTRQDHNNASRNAHYSYKAITDTHEFWVAEDFARQNREEERIEYAVSHIFTEINWYRLPGLTQKSYYSLRVAAGLILPLLSILSIVIALFYKGNIDIPVFVLQALLLADLIFLWQ